MDVIPECDRRIVGGVMRTGHLRGVPPTRIFSLSTPIAGSLQHRLRTEREITVLSTAQAIERPTYLREIPFAWSRRAQRKGVDWVIMAPRAFDVVVYLPRAVPMALLE